MKITLDPKEIEKVLTDHIRDNIIKQDVNLKCTTAKIKSLTFNSDDTPTRKNNPKPS